VAQQTAFINQLRDNLSRYWPESAGDTVFPDIDLYWVLDLLALYPDPTEIAAAGADAILVYLRERGSSVFKRTIDRVVDAASRNHSFAPDKAMLLLHTKQLALLLRQVLTCIVETEKAICLEVESDPDVRDIDAIKGISTVQAATFVAEVRSLGRFEDESHLASYSGFGRRKNQTGTTRNKEVQQRQANQILKRCVLGITETLSLHEERSRTYYRKKMQEGKGHRKALRALGRHLIRRLFTIMAKNRRAFLREALPMVA
jgi:transposase